MSKRWKQLLVLCVCLAVMAAGCAAPAGSEPTDRTTRPTTETTRPTLPSVYHPMTLSLGTVSAFVGDAVTVPLTITKDAYLVNADLTVTYDPTLLEPIATESGVFCQKAAWQGGLWSGVTEEGTLRLMLATDTHGESAALTLGVLSFRVLKEGSAVLTLSATAVGVASPTADEQDALAAGYVTVAAGRIDGRTAS